MVTVAVSSFNDLCDIYRRKSDSASIDSLSGEILVLYDSSPSLAVECGFNPSAQSRNERGQIITIDADAVLRIAAGTDIEVKDKIIIRSSWDETPSAWVSYPYNDPLIALIGSWLLSVDHIYSNSIFVPVGEFQFVANLKQFKINHYVVPAPSSVKIYLDGALLRRLIGQQVRHGHL